MILYKGEKYACLSCIRGHRSSSCDHRDRPLIQVRKRGRPNSTTPDQRVAIMPNEDGVINDQQSHYINGDLKNLKNHQPNNNEGIKFKLKRKQQQIDEELNSSGTAKYVSIGDGLYRRVPINNPDTHHQPDQQGIPASMFAPQQQDLPIVNGNNDPPLIIAPMEMDGQTDNDMLVNELSNNDVSNNGQYYFQASCILGDCQCGPTCNCEGCPIHTSTVT